MTLGLAMLLVLSATASVAIAQQPTPPAAETTAAPAPPADAQATPAPAPAAPAAPASKIDKGDTAWMLTPSPLVLMMTAPGAALLYVGMVRPQNPEAQCMHRPTP